MRILSADEHDHADLENHAGVDPARLPDDVRARAREPDGRGRIVAQRRRGAA
jgi:hypothetical protein